MFLPRTTLFGALLAAVVTASPAVGQMDYLSPQLSYERNFGYQSPSYQAPYPRGQYGGATLSGEPAYSVGGFRAGPGQQFLIYNPAAVARLPGLAGRSQTSLNWPPRGGPWGIGPAEQATAETVMSPTPSLTPELGSSPPAVPQPGTQPPDALAPQTETPQTTMPQTTTPQTVMSQTATRPTLTPDMMRPPTATADGFAAPAEQSVTSPLEQYVPRLPRSVAAYDQYRERAKRLYFAPNETSPPPEEQRAVSLAEVYNQRLKELSQSRNDRTRPASAAGNEGPPSLSRSLAPVYQLEGVGP